MQQVLRVLWNILTVLMPPLLLLHKRQGRLFDWLSAALWLTAIVCLFWFWAGPGLMLWFGCSLVVAWQLASKTLLRR